MQSTRCSKCKSDVPTEDGEQFLFCGTCGGDIAFDYASLLSDEPIDEEFAASVRSDRVKLKFYHYTHGHRWLLGINFDDEGSAYSGYVATRGQVRCLMLAAGIEVFR